MYLYGAGGHAKVITDILEKNNVKVEGIFDDNTDIENLFNYQVLSSAKIIEAEKKEIIVAIGENSTRKEIVERYKFNFGKAIHPNAVVSTRSTIGEGSVVIGGATINSCAKIGKHSIINTGASVGHDCIVEDFVHISPQAVLCGEVTVCEGAHIGAGAILIPGVTVGRWAVVGAGSVIIRDVPDFATVVGNPGRVTKIKFSVVNATDSKWSDIVSNSLQYDFYHFQSYHLLDKENEAVLFVYNFDNYFIAIPLIIRSIPDSDFNDCTSVYGYCGPISNIKFEEMPLEAIRQFKEGLNSFFIDRKIVSSFVRLHPLFPFQDILFKDFGEVITLNRTVAINLNQPINVQRSNYGKSTKLHINRALKNGVTARRTSDFEDLKKFIDIYYETMQKLSANSSYYFSLDYFRNLMNATDFVSELFVAEKDGEIIAGAIFTISNGIMQYHLGGTKNEMLIYSPLKLILDSARIYANEMGCNYFHLGGGYSGMDDSLFRFKAGFSKVFYEFKVWRKVVNIHAYNELIEKKYGDKIPNSDYFPLYRL
jgi:sugar O-acyltransferase (sialic acid O-acetyltransferase NeuD family)